MVHARNVRPPVAGATLVSIDEASVKDLPGFVQGGQQGQLRRGGVRARRAGHPRGAAAEGGAGRSRPRAPFPASEDLFTYMRSGDAVVRPASRSVVGNVDAASAGAATVIEAEYDVPFQGHTAIGPAHAMADPSNDQLTIYSNDMKSYGMRNGVAQFLEHAARPRAGGVDGGPAGLRPHRGRRCGVRGGVSGEGARASGAGAVDAPGRNGLGHQGSGLCDQACAAASMRKATWSRWTTTRARPITTTSATTSTTRS